ncbi:U1 small nuclear ribonucleoprotein 70 kDa-like [Olea europaea var. sylvestris]|uniref:U1 small nuclear ribonucleoprotein 70 kDa n=1 Tax=Olea europaea subsp. europaea TaxID=158383 RepID=A0A8S0QHX4_OLEEU|nr:U1 small nuclear ribonucleoprotein 70 kDa-like [Olea europaea var. sylvestris]CAA2966569.1 U1 small nuclear ribonucleo 70 kDa-like [Olea europaea subsp. europaea]
MGDYNDALLRNPNSAVQASAKAQNRNNVMQLKLIGQSHSTGLTPNLLKLFEARPPLEYKPAPEKRKCLPYTGMAQFVSHFAEPGDPQYAPPIQEAETHAQRRARIHKIRLEEGAKKAAEELEKYDSNNDPNISGDPYKTLFVARLNYEMTESRIKREFEAYGPIKRVRLVTDKETNKPRGYAFIEYMHTRDMKAGYKQADGKKIDNRRVLVDVERGRTVPNWRPRRLGGGLGTTRVGGEEVNQREQLQSRGTSRPEEPRIRDDRDREKSRERIRDREKSRERSHEISNEKPRDRDRRDDRHHRDRDRNRDRDRYRERDRGNDRERDHDRELTRDRYRGRDRERRGHDRQSEKERDRDRDRDRDYEDGDDHDRGRSRDGDYDYDHTDSKHERDRNMKEKNDDRSETEDNHGWHEQTEYRYEHPKREADHDHGHYERQSRGHTANSEAPAVYDRYKEADHDQMDEDGYRYDRDTSEPK